MRLNNMEQMVLKFFDDGNVELTMQRLCFAAMLSPKQGIKKMLCRLVEKLRENNEKVDTMATDDSASINEQYAGNSAGKMGR